MTRLMFVATYNKFDWGANATRLQDAALSLMFDDFLYPKFNETIIYYGPDNFGFDPKQYLEDLGISISNISFLPDQELLDLAGIYTNIIDFRPSIKQQLIKLIALDQCQAPVTMIQDCDIFAIKPYYWYQNGQVNLYHIANTSNYPEWYRYVEKFTGSPRVDTHCYMSEFLPITRQDWLGLRTKIELDFQAHWLTAITNQFRQDLAQGHELEFSEFELLANWILQQNHGLSTPQVRMTVPAPLAGRHESSESWYQRTYKKTQPNCLINLNLASHQELKQVAEIIRKHSN